MNKVVRDNYPASKLPSELRRGIADNASVRVTVEFEPSSPKADRALLIEAVQRMIKDGRGKGLSAAEAAERIRRLREEWED